MMRSIALSLCSLLCFACGGGDDDGGGEVAVDSAPLADLTAEDLLEMLLDVDGDGSGLDADTIDGIDSDELARVTRRSVDVQPSSLEIDGAADPTLANDLSARMTLRFRIPPDAVPEQPLEVHVRGTVQSGTPCGMVLGGSALVFTGDGELLPLTIVGGNTVTVTNDDFFTIRAKLDPADPSLLVPGAWLFLDIARAGGELEDTCTAGMGIVGVAVEYEGL